MWNDEVLEYLSARWQDEGMDDKTQKGCRQCGTDSYYVPWYPLDLGVAISYLQLLKNDGPLEGPSWQILLLLGLEF